MSVHGILNINKPPGPTSMDMVRLVKRLTRERKVGHGGTLDPVADGVLPICLGQATRMMDHLIESTKVYLTQVVLGVATDTFDTAGTVVRTEDPSGVTLPAVEKALEAFRGHINQVPPMYSALKKGGTRLYNLARAGVEVPRAPRQVQVLRLELKDWDPPIITLEVECGRGVYIRALAHDLGEALGCGAHLKALTRLRTGPFSLEEAISPAQLEEVASSGSWQQLVNPPDIVVGHLRAAVVGAPMVAYLKQGREVALGPRGRTVALHQEHCRIYTTTGRFLAVAQYDRSRGQWRPDRVFELDQAPFDEGPTLKETRGSLKSAEAQPD